MKYCFVLGPLLLHAILAMTHWAKMRAPLSAEEAQAEAHRSIAIGMAGFSFTAALALLAFSDAPASDLEMPIYSSFMSFVLYLASLNLQSYKFTRLWDLVGDALRDAGSLSLLLCLIYSLRLVALPGPFEVAIVLAALIVWAADLLIRLYLMNGYLKESSNEPGT